MSDKSPIVQVRLPGRILKKIDEIIVDLNRKSTARPWTRSSYVRHCIEMQLVIQEQRDKVRSPNRHKCKTCGKMKDITKIAYTLTDLHGERENYCKDCHPGGEIKNQSPPM